MPTTYAIPNGRTVMDATTYTGNGSTQSITNAAGFQPDLVWIKNRTGVYNHRAFDSIRGATKILYPNATDAELTDANSLTAFNSNGFSLGTAAGTNNNTDSFVGWQWKAGGTAVSNTSGTITSSVSANTTAGFSIVTWTGTGATGTIGHGLGITPSFFIVKNRTTAATNWSAWFTGFASTEYLLPNLTDAKQTNGSTLIWSGTHSSSIINIGSGSQTNGSGNSLVAYCWTPIAGYSAFGSYTGNGSANGPFVYLGFRPKFVMLKRTDSTGAWYILDTSINSYNEARTSLQANSSAAEVTDTNFLDILSNGFKLRTSGAAVNGSGGTYIYMAFAENPTKFANAR